jgi:hypothetical protein
MKRIATRILPLMSLAILIVVVSIHLDMGTRSWVWFQSSGSLVVLIGAVLGYRSIFRLGKSGVGGAQPIFVTGKSVSVDDTGPVQMVKLAFDEPTQIILKEADYDKRAGFVGVLLIISGTLIWGYGDLLGLLYCLAAAAHSD